LLLFYTIFEKVSSYIADNFDLKIGAECFSHIHFSTHDIITTHSTCNALNRNAECEQPKTQSQISSR
jgi:hypothetical protein